MMLYRRRCDVMPLRCIDVNTTSFLPHVPAGQFLAFYLDLLLGGICAVCHQFGLLSTYLYTWCSICKNFQLWMLFSLYTGNSFAAYANLFIKFFQSIRHNRFEESVERRRRGGGGGSGRGGGGQAFLPNSSCYSEPFSHAAIHLRCTYSLVIEAFKSAN